MKPAQTPEIKARRIKAFHLYLDGIMGGKRRSTRSIAQELGVTVKAVDYWVKKDQWEARAGQTLGQEQALTLASHRSLQTLIQADFSTHMTTLTKIINDSAVATKDRILGIKEFASIALRLGAIKPDDTPAERLAATEFKDDLDSGASSDGPVVADSASKCVDYVVITADVGAADPGAASADFTDEVEKPVFSSLGASPYDPTG